MNKYALMLTIFIYIGYDPMVQSFVYGIISFTYSTKNIPKHMCIYKKGKTRQISNYKQFS